LSIWTKTQLSSQRKTQVKIPKTQVSETLLIFHVSKKWTKKSLIKGSAAVVVSSSNKKNGQDKKQKSTKRR